VTADQTEARAIRRRVLDDSLAILKALEWELEILQESSEPLSKEFVDKFAKVADQIRRDAKVKPVDGDITDDEPAEIPLGKLKLVS
jgi:hypothetical protein